jgi:hypothetical protein
MASEFEVGGKTYRCDNMDARKQFHVMRRLAGVLDALKEIPKGGDGDGMLAAIAPIAKAIASMSDEDCDYVLDACLNICQRQEGPGWAKIWNAQAKRSMFDDVNMAIMLQIAVKVLQDSFAAFFPALPSVLKDAAGE